jgi:hypothetical protein
MLDLSIGNTKDRLNLKQRLGVIFNSVRVGIRSPGQYLFGERGIWAIHSTGHVRFHTHSDQIACTEEVGDRSHRSGR